ncbi:uncharacterized protein BROUX77_006976 [Berkeleyomyces rouxiae]|uniref:uncharacterized protein n=1 Tax=Berkeleyomyces rouxiae TaxID=2035830 RepID=UPI003B7A5BF0
MILDPTKNTITHAPNPSADHCCNEDDIQSLEKRVQEFDPAEWWRDTMAAPGLLIKMEQERGLRHQATQESETLNNPFEGISYAWQTYETSDAFVKRLPPSTTQVSPLVPWIYICNPHSHVVTHKTRWKSQASRGNEDEGPEIDGADLQLAQKGAMERLERLLDFMQDLEKKKKLQASKTKEANCEKAKTVCDILELSHANKIRSGKWMLFVEAKAVDDIWKVVAQATIENTLGVAAKVQPCPELDSDHRRTERLICIYTKDFSDQMDVKRVFFRLQELKVLLPKPIYYKPDIYTYLGISYGNKYDIKASIYSSKDFILKK